MTRAAFKTAVEELLGISPGTLRDTDSRDTIESWSSLEDLNLLALIRTDLGIEAGAEILQMETIGELLDWLAGQGAFVA